VIRFSAGLVVVALGVLIGGGVTSKLSLVYVSIAISALALIAWTIGVFLKREELFGNGSELVPADAGTSAESLDPGQSTSAPLSPASSAPPASSAASTVSAVGQDRPAYGEGAFSQGALNTVAFSPGAQVHPTWMPEEPAPRPDLDRVAAPVGGWAATTTSPSGTPQGAPRAWDGSKEPQASAPASAGTGSAAGTGTKSADAGSGSTLRNWFDRPAQFEPSAPPADKAPTPPAETAASADTAASAVPAAPVPPTGEPPAEQQSGTRLVTVVPGVPRYHEPNCILIRFMSEDDIQKKSIPEAKAGKCTPCAACQPED
jgi:hypothetical protein